jgi:valyl-tRNA synthetase
MSDVRVRELPKAYEPAEVEHRLYDWWERSGFFHAEPGDPGEPYCIVIPLPNVTGSLHIGHALDHSVQDALIRRARMQGKNAMWQPGTDHAGIATQNVVERELAKEGISRHDLGRDEFVRRVWAWREQSGGTILRQMRRLGASCDWQREAFTLDEPRSRAVREVFCRLYEEGLIYRGYRLINWCPRCRTALSDIEVDHADEPTELVTVRYPPAGGDGGGIAVATTRPETMLGDTAVAVHPDDARYADLVGTTVVLPLLDREIPVIADEHVDPEFGTGAVKITPAHDPNDYEIGQRHGLEAIDVMNDDMTINERGGPYEGLDRFEARRRIMEDLQARGLVEHVEQIVHAVGVCSRCGTIVEPRLSDQWFVKVEPLVAAALDAVRAGRTRFVPERNAKPFLDWLENLRDWCISRQLWWGHRIPAWYDPEGNIGVYREDPWPEEVAARGLRQDPDVLDTWFSSALWPFSTLGWPEHTRQLDAWYPGAVLVTGYDINTFWVSRMLMMGLHFLHDVPFHVVCNHGLVRDRFGKKMSKSFGNVIDPLEFMDRYGADALRFALLRAAAPGQDVPLAEEWVEGARRFANKLWNAARFVLTKAPGAAEPAPHRPEPEALALEPEDRWILSRLEEARATADEAYDAYDLSRAARSIYHFVWDEFCDWYLELAKLRDDETVDTILTHVLDQALRLLHPIMPFVTEEIWRTLRGTGETIMKAAWPPPAPQRRDPLAEERMAVVQEAVTGLRRFRAEHRLAPSARLEVIAVIGDSGAATPPLGRGHGDERDALEAGVDGIACLAGVRRWSFADTPPATASGAGRAGTASGAGRARTASGAGHVVEGPVGKVVLSGAELFVPLAGLVDLDEERARLRRELDRATTERDRARRKLDTPGFVAKAPEAVVQAERDKLLEWEAALDKLAPQLEALR